MELSFCNQHYLITLDQVLREGVNSVTVLLVDSRAKYNTNVELSLVWHSSNFVFDFTVPPKEAEFKKTTSLKGYTVNRAVVVKLRLTRVKLKTSTEVKFTHVDLDFSKFVSFCFLCVLTLL